MKNFYFHQPTEIHFEAGGLSGLGELCKKQGSTCLLITSPPIPPLVPLYERTIKILEESGLRVIHYSEVLPNPSTEIVDAAIKLANENSVDVVVSLGGGSTMDTGKIVSLCSTFGSAPWEKLFSECTNPFGDYQLNLGKKIPLIAIPTTAGTGSQCTQAAVITDVNTKLKLTVFSKDLFPDYAIVDPELTLSLPQYMTSCTGFDAFSHSFESFVGGKLAPHAELMALKGMAGVINYLPLLQKENKLEYRANLSFCDTMGGITLANGGAYIPHPLGEIISSYSTRINHGQSLAMVYPASVKYSWKQNIKAYATIARLFDKELASKPDEFCAEQLSSLLSDFIKLIGLDKKPEVTEEQKEKIFGCDILKHLPMTSQENLINILKESI